MLLYAFLVVSLCSHIVYPHRHGRHHRSDLDLFDSSASSSSYSDDDSDYSDYDSSSSSASSLSSSSSSSSSSEEGSRDFHHIHRGHTIAFPAYANLGGREEIVDLKVHNPHRGMVSIGSPFHRKKGYIRPLKTYTGY